MTLAPSPSSKKSSCAERPSSVHTVVLLRALCKRLTLTTLRGPVLKYCQQGAGHLLGYFENGDLGRITLVVVRDVEEMPALPLPYQPEIGRASCRERV